MARPKITWDTKDYKVLEGLCAVMCTQNEIETVMSTSIETIDRLCKEHYTDKEGNPMGFSEVYKKYSESGKMSLRRAQFKLAEKSAVMAIFLGKNYLGQKDTPKNGDSEHTDDGLIAALFANEEDWSNEV